MYNLVDFFSILLLIIITLFIALRWPAVSKILLIALAVRLIFLFVNNHIFYLPDGDMDAKNFEQLAWKHSQDGFYNNFNNYSGKFNSRNPISKQNIYIDGDNLVKLIELYTKNYLNI
jgi:hypothetical protein